MRRSLFPFILSAVLLILAAPSHAQTDSLRRSPDTWSAASSTKSPLFTRGDVWFGAVITSVLFTLGKFVLGLYLGHASIGSAYGAAGYSIRWRF